MMRPAFACAHRRDRVGGRVERRGEVDRDDRVPFLDRKFLDARNMLDARVVDQDLHCPQGLGRLRDRARGIQPASTFGADVPGLYAMLLGEPMARARSSRFSVKEFRRRCSLLRESLGDAKADAGI